MNNLLLKLKGYAPILARYGVGIVFFIFGIDQLVRPGAWIAWVPDYIINFAVNFGVSNIGFIYFNGLFDLIVGFLLLAGLFVRLVALIGALHITGIIFSLGYNDISIRDFGLLLVLISVFLNGQDELCLGRKLMKNLSGRRNG